jgi:2-keto-4-pentenoate hydratase
MALSQDEIRKSAERLDQAEKTRKQIRQLSLEHPGITIEDAYAIQKAWVEMKVAEGRTVKGHKIGLTSKAMQSALNIDEPDSGILLDDMFFADGGLVPTERFEHGAVRAGEPLLHDKGLAAGVLNHPATAVAWLANKIEPNGLALEAGQVVLAGSFIRPIETRKGDTIQADYGPYGSVSCYFA